MGEGSLSQEDIDALLGGFGGGANAPAGGGSGGGGLDDLDALVGGGGGDDNGPSFADIAAALGPSATPSPARSGAKTQSGSGNNTANLNLLLDVTLQLTIELGRTTMFIKDVLQLTEGTVVELDKNIGEELDILANGKLVGRGKLIILDDYYGVQITQIVDPMERLGGPAFL
ncbi:flagellar motor switch protein FliN [Leptospira sp. 85282-16]|uniref:Flagellar motor switch protein FliN n=1 Tax=Leptospira montravelensis TaxID=2484961 RepID=A0ABY2LYL3_9LEPT|nr:MULTISPECIES: flagellar motor switch protein FliN [Leptospira]MCT8332640.1 flagellar motor switch protein FliN [Leptospira sp. 85282-16]TGK83850.1 flagellar motor switch protein FliN [Leptospira montravelensis]TGL05857.1 flagellar motor switch protein FliN [Leptospira montravelensis]